VREALPLAFGDERRAVVLVSRQRAPVVVSAIPPSMHASLDPVVEQPVASTHSGACHRSARMLTQRDSSSAVCGYSSLSIMFFSSAPSRVLRWRVMSDLEADLGF
jgi:hypothetical protein